MTAAPNTAATLAHYNAAVEQLRKQPPTLREIAERAIAADEAFNRLCRVQIGEPTADDECDFMAAEESQFAAREALYAALERHGVDRELASQIGRVLG